MKDHTQRFSTRADNYARYRPSYPEQVLDVLREECGLRPDAIVADIGSGTGLLTELFLRNGNTVYAVEPNREMREAGERLLGDYNNFTSVDGTAEATTLGDQSVDA
ncbi:MAG TPA: methyltransferase domain-containing protein, partial [Patescibacteria group bacterium]|nr:methyltransferase domain-containing protein [Patescibacteria group bacterium]